MDVIDLDTIIKEANGGILPDRKTLERAKASYRKAINQALVLASEKAKGKRVYMPQGGYVNGKVDKQSILDVEKLVK